MIARICEFSVLKARMAAWPDGPRLFARFRDPREPSPSQVVGLPAYVRKLGLSSDLVGVPGRGGNSVDRCG